MEVKIEVWRQKTSDSLQMPANHKEKKRHLSPTLLVSTESHERFMRYALVTHCKISN
uniref:Uncharacterized protein n=1 Tax=Arion vulgaris TaxID=1028688 RepID=A0A0B6YB25_9EUPU